MKQKHERKDAVTSLRWSEQDRDIATKNAKARGMSRNAYIEMAVRQAENHTLPETKVMIQNAVNRAKEELRNGNMDAIVRICLHKLKTT